MLCVFFETADAVRLTRRHCTNVTLRSNFLVRYKNKPKKALHDRGERAQFPHERSHRSPSSAVKPFCLAHPHPCCSVNTCLCSNPTSLRQFADPDFARYEQRWDGRSISGHGEFLRADELSFPVCRLFEYLHCDISRVVYELLPPSQHTSAPSGDGAACCRTLELCADTGGASNGRDAILGRCARVEWPN
jgi:hypothetical protein